MSLVSLLFALAVYAFTNVTGYDANLRFASFLDQLIWTNFVFFVFSVLLIFVISTTNKKTAETADTETESYARVYFALLAGFGFAIFATYIMRLQFSMFEGMTDPVKFAIGVLFYFLSILTVFALRNKKVVEQPEEQTEE